MCERLVSRCVILCFGFEMFGVRDGKSCVLFFMCLLGVVRGKEHRVEFIIHPGGKSVVEIPLDTPPIADSTCRFEYNVFGATPEVRCLSLFPRRFCSGDEDGWMGA